MILRIVRGSVPPDGFRGLAEGFETVYAPLARATPGLERFHVAVRPHEDGHALAVVTFWSSVDAALAAYDGDLDAPRTLDGLATHATLDEVAHFEVDETRMRSASGPAAVLRITVGCVAQGIDAAIQAELRNRIHELPEDVTEAYVGRRIVGTDVEVAFISAWERVPPGWNLDAPVWPDIAARYDQFLVETFVPIVSGSPAGAG